MMKKTKKILLTLGLFLLCSITGCSSGTDKKSDSQSVNSAVEANAATTDEPKRIKNIGLFMGESYSLTEAADITDETAEYKSSKPKYVSVDDCGNLHALKAGKAVITVKTEEATIKCRVNVRKKGMVYPEFTMMKNEHLDLQFSNDTKVKSWTSSDKSVAKVSKDGQVIAKKKGTAVITGKADGRTYTCNLKVTKRIKNRIYLTFDDGPNRYSTTKILNILKKNNVKATFFELRPAGNDFDLTKRVIDEGHTLAMHGFQHKYDQIYKSVPIYHENLDKLQNLFFKKFGVWCTVSRFPGGSSNTVSRYNKGVMTAITKDIHSWGYHYFDWNVDSGDAGGSRTADDVYSHVTSGLYKNRGNVVLMHDFMGNDKTIDALERIIKYGKKNGYTFLPITASTDEVHHTVNN